jgi:hypothetical protein
MFEHYNRLGFFNPFYIEEEAKLRIEPDFPSIIQHVQHRVIDPAAIVEIFSKNHCFADRTPIQGIQRTPWMARPDAAGEGWEFCEIPEHGERLISTEAAAGELFSRLQEEVLELVEGRTTVGILLSGGMDSRMVAGALDRLITTRRLDNVRVVALSWGNENSRDAVYAAEIARRLGWEWEHFVVSAEDVLRNIHETAKRGCEYSPIHLHAMPRIRELGGLDCILAGSFGDSVGRAEFSGKNVHALQPLDTGISNRYHMLDPHLYRSHHDALHEDLETYHRRFPRPEPYQQCELDQQLHYMRRMINPCMGVINEKIPVFQLFSKPSVFGFMWSMAPHLRNNDIYRSMMQHFSHRLDDIPWARTGLPFPQTQGEADGLGKIHDSYRQIINHEIFDTVRQMVLSTEVSRLNLFNMDALESLLTCNRILPHASRTWLDDKLLWIASLSEFARLYQVQGLPRIARTPGARFVDRVAAPVELLTEKAAGRLKRFRN